MLLHLLHRRGAGVCGVLDWLGLLAVAINTNLVALAYVFLGGSDKGVIHPALRCACRDAACFTSKAGAYGSYLGREQLLYGWGSCR